MDGSIVFNSDAIFENTHTAYLKLKFLPSFPTLLLESFGKIEKIYYLLNE
jgi:hypothetical protein